jgi:hypothetical protein
MDGRLVRVGHLLSNRKFIGALYQELGVSLGSFGGHGN